MLASLKGFRPLPRAMQDGENVTRVFQDAIGDDVRRSGHIHFPRASDAADSAGIGHAGGLTNGEPNALDRPEGGGGVFVCDVIEDFMELLDRWQGPPKPHDLARAFACLS